MTQYQKQIREEMRELLSGKLALTLGVFLSALAVPFILQTDSLLAILTSVCLTVAAAAIIVVFFILQRKHKIR